MKSFVLGAGTMSIQAAKRPDEALGTYTSGQHCTYERILITSREPGSVH